MDQITAIRMFVRVVESGSFSAVAREFGIGQPAVSKQITALEAHLGAQLLRRTSRSLSLTEAGQDFYESAVRLIDDLAAAEQRVGRGQSALSGLIRVTVAPVFGRLYVVPRLPEFFARHPDIIIESVVTDRIVNLVEEGVDLAIHNGELKDSSLVVRKIATTPIITVASPDYLKSHGEPVRPRELDAHRCVVFAPQGAPRAWGFKGRFGDSSIARKVVSAQTMRIRSARRFYATLDWRTRPGGCSHRRSRLALCAWCCATTSRRRCRSVRSIPRGGGCRPRFESPSIFWPGVLRGNRALRSASGIRTRDETSASVDSNATPQLSSTPHLSCHPRESGDPVGEPGSPFSQG